MRYKLLAAFLFAAGPWLYVGYTTIGCGSPPRNTVYADPATNTYTLDDKFLNASGDVWTPAYSVGGFGVRIQGGGESIMFEGGIDGPLPNAAVYECSSDGCAAGTSEHCPGGSSGVCGTCASPCYEYHTRAGIDHATVVAGEWDGSMDYNRQCIVDEGDGISAQDEDAGPLVCSQCYFRSIHDDVMESDWCDDLWLKDSLVESAFMLMAMDPRTNDPQDCTGSTIKITNSVVDLQRFPYAYKNKPGHGGVFKVEEDNQPQYIVQDSIFLIGPVVGDGQDILPNPDRIPSGGCANNTIYFSGSIGTGSQLEAWLADEDGLVEGQSNQERLTALSSCYTLVTRTAGQTESQFLWDVWLPARQAWVDANVVGDDCL